ncbi:type II secretion system F family protein [Aliidiomarina quisquiliarum]|uniref:type II secretion system F family protein n=1 Tax=Aliidiomarina quisquiliarum TaxID=2938947 RepID=UPI00208E3C24|nr:type II secretion system F family protein [Aliidiomarina quisquiliarum]MCO4321762.1 type II secretion system F family protein [Aliidiomarina quisquiliarum]
MAAIIIVLVWALSTAVLAVAVITFKYLVKRVETEYEVRLQRGLAELFMFLPARQLLVFWALLVLFLTTVLLVFKVSWIMAIVLLTGTAILPPYIYKRLVKNRRKRFVAQLPDACMLIANTLRTGGTVAGAIHFVRSNAAAPLSQEFSLVSRSLRLGSSLADALLALYQRLPSDELERMVTGLLLGQESGGQQARLLEQISASLRSRAQLARRVHSLSAQGKMQGKVMSGLPFFLATALWFLEPIAMEHLMSTPLGWILLATMVLLIVVGHWLIKRTVNIEVPL